MLVNTNTFKMNKAFACYLEYGDTDGLNEDEINTINNFLDRLGIEAQFYEYIGLDDSDFGPCDITGLGCDRVTVNVWQWKDDNENEDHE